MTDIYKKAVFTLIVILSIISCLSTSCNQADSKKMAVDEINPIVMEYVTQTTRSEDVEYMKELLEKAIQTWVQEYSNMGFYKEEDYHISDTMIFAKSKDKVLIFIHALLKDSDDGQVKLIAGQLQNDDTWNFRYSGLPNFYYEYREDLRKGKKFTAQELMARTIDQMVDDGLISSFNQVSQDYLSNKWF